VAPGQGLQSFRARIRKEGVNPYVEVPERVSRAFAPRALAGRIRVEGRLRGVPIRATLIPVGAGRHRLYVNGGMRSAAGVDTGDVATFALRAVGSGTESLPRDLAKDLRGVRGGRAAFDALPASRRRELLRYVDDARTAQGRAQRIGRAIENVLEPRARATVKGRSKVDRPLWTCPRCGNQFVNRNQWHSCAVHGLDEPFAGKPARIREMFERFRAMVEACGPIKVVPYRGKVGFMVQVRFAGAVPRADSLDVVFWLPRRIDDPRFLRVETVTPAVHIYTVRITEPQQLDSELEAWIREAYAVGCREHLGGARAPGTPPGRDRS